MALAERKATVSWLGDLKAGGGTVRLGNGALGEFPVSWSSRIGGDGDGATSPEELIAGAQAACLAMALAHALAQQGKPPEQLDVSAEATLDVTKRDGLSITELKIDVRGKVPGLNDGDFAKMAKGALAGCPVNRALEGVNTRLEARLT